MADDIRALSAQLAQDPQSLVFLRLGEALRRKGQLDAAMRVAMNGLERHPHLADAHDLYARILTDKHDYQRAFDEWDMAVRIAPHHTGALKGLAFLYFKVGDVAQAEAHLEQARKVEPDDPSIDQAIAMMRKGASPPPPTAPTADSSTAASPTAASSTAPAPTAGALDEARVFAGLEGSNEGLLLIDGAGRVLGGALKDKAGTDVTDAVAAYLAGVSQEAARTAKLLGLGAWMGLSAEGQNGNVHLSHPTPEALLLVVRERGMPLGRLAILAQRATLMARRWLEKQ
jgi:tetratricopeptide (TPR) repeat protein